MEKREVIVQFAADSRKIEINMDPYTIVADGGDRTEPSPGTLFLAGLMACTASTARGYCFRNNLPLPVGLKATVNFDDDEHLVDHIEMDLLIPPEFPRDHVEALERAAGKCTVKKWWMNPPEFLLRTSDSA